MRAPAPDPGRLLDVRAPVLIVPGLGGSGPDHWQSLWQQALGATRFHPASWDRPDRADWLAALRLAVDACAAPPVVVAHSLGCHATADLLHAAPGSIAGALLVAPPDLHAPDLPEEVRGFRPGRREPLGVRAVLVGGRDDPYASTAAFTALAGDWRVPFVDAGAIGHVNADSGIGDWPAGRALLDDLMDAL